MMVAHLIPDNTLAMIVPLMPIIISFFISIRVGISIIVLVVLNGYILKNLHIEQIYERISKSS